MNNDNELNMLKETLTCRNRLSVLLEVLLDKEENRVTTIDNLKDREKISRLNRAFVGLSNLQFGDLYDVG